MTEPTTNDRVRVEQLDLRDDGTSLTLEVRLYNALDRTVHAYASARTVRYDPATRDLVVGLTDEGAAELPSTGHFTLPAFASVDPNASGTVTVTLPRTLRRMSPAPDQVSISFETLAIHEARTLTVRVAWSDTPFYVDPRPQRGTARAQLVDWQHGVASGSTRLGPSGGAGAT